METMMFHNFTDEQREEVKQFLSTYKPLKNEHVYFLSKMKEIGKTLKDPTEKHNFDLIQSLFRAIHSKEKTIQRSILNLYLPLLPIDSARADLCKLMIEEDILQLNEMVSNLEAKLNVNKQTSQQFEGVNNIEPSAEVQVPALPQTLTDPQTGFYVSLQGNKRITFWNQPMQASQTQDEASSKKQAMRQISSSMIKGRG